MKMIKLLIAADDLTGALDTGVRFAGRGIKTLVTTDADIDINGIDDHTEVLVVDTETRHLSADEAYKIVYALIEKAVSSGIGNIYKKTDSVMRGNIGSELLAVLNGAASGAASDKLMLVPAFPDNDRTTSEGVQYVSGVPLAQSHFACDPFDPVTVSYIPDMIGKYTEHTDIRTVIVKQGEKPDFDAHRGIFIFDAETNEDMVNIGDMLNRAGQLGLTAGCAGFAGVLSDVLNFTRHKQELPAFGENTLIVSGSVNKMSIEQIDHLKENGCKGVSLTPEQKQDGDFCNSTGCDGLVRTIQLTLAKSAFAYIEVIKSESNIIEADRSLVAEKIGQIVKRVQGDFPIGNLIVIGGDTLLGIMRQLDVKKIIPAFELSPGIACSKIESGKYSFNLITKSGGFGQKETLMNVLSWISTKSDCVPPHGSGVDDLVVPRLH